MLGCSLQVSLSIEPGNPRVLYNAATVLGEAAHFTAQLNHFRAARSVWFNKFATQCPGARISRVWTNCGSSAVTAKHMEQRVAPGSLYGLNGHEARQGGLPVGKVGSSAGAFDNLVFQEKQIVAVSISGAQLEGHAAVMHCGCHVLMGSQDLYVPLHEQALHPMAPRNEAVTYAEAISVVS